ncbi:MAG: hypothetical protein ACREQ7_10065 [Candidatus Binatia bacterium]
MRIQTTTAKTPSSAEIRRAARWRTIGYTAAVMPFLLIVALAWLVPDFNRTEIPDWRPVLSLAEESLKKGDLYEARHLYLQVSRIASWREDWEGLIAAACGINRLDRIAGPYSKAFSILLRAMMAAEHRRSRQGIATVAKAFVTLGADKTATMVLARIRTGWPEEMQKQADVSAAGCWDPNEGS